MIDFDFAALRRIGLTQVIANQLYTLSQFLPDTSALQAGRITEVHRDWFTIHQGVNPLHARIQPSLLHALDNSDTSLAVGDWVLLDQQDKQHGQHGQHEQPRIIARMPPLTHLARRSNDGRRQALASNIDTALLIMGLDHDFNLRRLERYLALVLAADVAPVIILTKADVSTHADIRLTEVTQRLSGSVPVFAVNGQSAATAELLAPWMGAGQTLILLGSSGAGKSTLTNTLAATMQGTGEVRAGDSRGHHTTTARSLHLCPNGACIIDTPGLRSLQLDLDEVALSASFEDIDTLAKQCQFRDCKHQTEPGCAVRAVVDEDRLRNYQKLLREAHRNQQTPLDKIAARSKWKVLMRSVKERDKQKRG